eukprot:CAMPEP_0184253480 /NCGR_PEP_ID=MMETSP0977-20130417/6730_1 /TAXON_ID=483370 /ORGANISM="non described non described, Strain CCMP2097" /LENGTH=43 /DNA_ID= /DNA_START= /DNA_END= /DNA_ORIENTATION=
MGVRRSLSSKTSRAGAATAGRDMGRGFESDVHVPPRPGQLLKT